jgi:hypothetical protein
MFDDISSRILILIPIAIFVGRFILQARNAEKQKKKTPPPPPRVKPRRIEEDRPHWERAYEDKAAVKTVPAAKTQAQKARPVKALAEAFPSKAALSSKEDKLEPFSGARSAVPAASIPLKTKSPNQGAVSPIPGLEGFSNLSPLKQAVVMAEVLGPPKALQFF